MSFTIVSFTLNNELINMNEGKYNENVFVIYKS